mgnify:CR=1 FL=1
MDQYTNTNHPLYVPGTFNIYAEQYDLEAEFNGAANGSPLKRDGKTGIVLIPQPSDSPNDPLNWSYWRKTWHFLLMAYITAFTAATSNDAGAAQDSLNEIYGISYDAMNTGAGVLFLGIGWGTLVCAPFANLYGRRLTYLICISLGLFGGLWFGLAKKTSDTIWSQLFVGISEACAEAQVQLSLSDIFFQHQLGSVLTVYIMATSIGTFLGPLIAGYIADLTSFRWVGYTALIISGGTLLVLVFGCEETYFDRSLYRTPINYQASLHGTTTTTTGDFAHSDNENGLPSDSKKDLESKNNNNNNNNADQQQEFGGSSNSEKKEITNTFSSSGLEPIQSGEDLLIDGKTEPKWSYWKRVAFITKATNLRGYGFKQYFEYLLITVRMFAFPAVWISGLFWGWQDVLLSFYLTIEEDNYYEDPWNYSDAAVAIMNVPTLIGAVLGCMYAGIVSDYFVLWMARKNKGILEAEYRLYFSIAVAILSPAGLFMFGIASGRGFTNWRTAYMGLAFIGFGWGCAGDIAMAYLMDCYPEMVLEGMVCTSLINNNLACIFTFTCSYWLDDSGIENTFIALGVLTFFFTFLAWPMFVYGKRARKWSKNLYLRCIEQRGA